MMRARRQARQMADIVAVRDVQRLMAQLRVLKAQAAVAAEEEARARCLDEIGTLEVGWRNALARSLVRHDVLGFWSQELLAKVENLGGIELDLTAARAEAEVDSRTWHIALSRHKLAAERVRALRSAVRDEGEERRLAELADNHLVSRLPPRALS